MARSINRLSARTVDSITTPGRHADGGNLFLIVDKPSAGSGKPSKRWAFIYRWDGRLREMGLGSVTAINLARAREIAAQHRVLLAEGKDPIEVRRQEQRQQSAGRSFGDVARDLHASRRGGWKNEKFATQWLTSLEAYCRPFWSKPVATVTTDDVLAVLQPIWTAKAETASRTRGRIEAVLDSARVRGLIPSDRANPARWKGHLAYILGKRIKLQRGHHPALQYANAPAFIADLRMQSSMSARCLEFLVLTAVRSAEAMGARWTEIDFAAKVWTIPRERMKKKREHRVPLADRCLEILRELEPLRSSPDAFIFPGRKPDRPLSVMALEMVLRRMKIEGVTVHGMRSTFRDWCGECTNIPREIAEEALSHLVGNQVERSYRRGDALEKRRAAMQAWADYCSGASVNNVVPLRRASE